MYLFRTVIFIVLLLLPFSVGNFSESEACRGRYPVIEEVPTKTLPFQLFRQGLPWHGFEYHQSKQTPHLTKFFVHLAEGNFKYAFKRLWLNARSLILNLWQQSMLFAFAWLLLTVFAIVFVVQKKKGRKFLYTMMPLGLLLLLVLLGKNDVENEVVFRSEELQFKVDSEKPFGISEIRSGMEQIIGHLFWVDQSEVLFDYICCSGSIENQVDSVTKHSFPLALMAASYFDEENKPAGFLSVKGELHNYRFNPDWDGLLILKSGEMSIGNLQTMKLTEKKCDTDNDRNDYPFAEPFACAVDDPQNILIQLPLLVFDHQLLIDYRKTPYRLREMRFLALISDQKQKVYLLLVNIEVPFFLSNIVYSLFNQLAGLGFRIDGLLMLDVGSNNYLQVYGQKQKVDTRFKGNIRLSHANNILFFMLKNPYPNDYSDE